MGIRNDTEQAIDLGKEAFTAGKSRHCYADLAWVTLLAPHVKGKADLDPAARMRLGMAWYRGWDRANMTAPIT